MNIRYLVVALALFLSAGCGYRAPGQGASWVGQQGRTLCVELFANRTVEPYLDSVMTEEMSTQFSRSRLVELVEDRARADLLFGGTVTAFESRASAYGVNDQITEYRATMTVRARLVRRDSGAVLWQEEIVRYETYPAMQDKSRQQEGESLAGRVVARRIAEDLYAHLLNAF